MNNSWAGERQLAGEIDLQFGRGGRRQRPTSATSATYGWAAGISNLLYEEPVATRGGYGPSLVMKTDIRINSQNAERRPRAGESGDSCQEKGRDDERQRVVEVLYRQD
jgi:hypothetical protein